MSSPWGPAPVRRLTVPAALLALLTGLLSMMVVSAALGRFDLRLSLVAGEAALVAPFFLIVAAGRLSAPDTLGLRRIPRSTAVLAAVCGVVFWMTSAGIVATQSTLWPPPPSVLEFFHRMQTDLGSGAWNTAASIVALAVVPAIAEELAFRGALLGTLEYSVGPPLAIALSAVLFGLIHWTPGAYRIPFAFILGLALGIVRVRTRSIVPGILAHAVLNTITLTLPSGLDDPVDVSAAPLLPSLLLLAGGGALSALLMARLRALTPDPGR